MKNTKWPKDDKRTFNPNEVMAVELLDCNKATVTVKCYNIGWDTDGAKGPAKTKVFVLDCKNLVTCKVLKKCDIHEATKGKLFKVDHEELENYISDFLTDSTGFCHTGFDFAVTDFELCRLWLDDMKWISDDVRKTGTVDADRLSAALWRKHVYDRDIRDIIANVTATMDNPSIYAEDRVNAIDKLTKDFRDKWGGTVMH